MEECDAIGIYNEENLMFFLENDEISDQEEAFMEGYLNAY